MKLRKLLLGTALTLVISQAQAQYGQGMMSLNGHVAAQMQNPGRIADGEFEKFRYAGSGQVWLGNTDAPIDSMFGDDTGYLSRTTRDRFIGNLKGNVGLAGGYRIDPAIVNVHLGPGVLAVSLSDMLNVSAQINNPLTAGLILNGNKPYAGTTITDQDIFANISRVRTLGIGYGIQGERLGFGGRLNLYQGQSMNSLNVDHYSITTDTLGTRIQVAAAYDYTATRDTQPGFFAFQGMGAGVDLGMSLKLGESLRADLSLTDLGFVSWKTNTWSSTIDMNWEGISINSIFQDSLPEEVQQAADSLENLLLPDSVAGNTLTLMGTTLRAGAEYRIGERNALYLLLAWSPMHTGPWSRSPMAGLTYRRELIDRLYLGASASVGGQQGYTFGLMGDYTLDLSTVDIRLSLGSDNVLGLWMPAVGRGYSLWGGLSVAY